MYIDPNTGGMLFQVLAVVFAAFSGMVLIFSRQIRTALGRFRRMLRGKNQEENSVEPTEDKQD
jgi:hypothetical protein